MANKLTYSKGIFHYADELPHTGSQISLGEGNTPTIPLKRLGEHIGLPNLYAKLESSNPTGSYKDRVAAMSISLAVDAGKLGWIATSSGNAGTSLAAYANRAGLPGFLVVVPNIPREKLLPILGLGNARVMKVSGIGDKGDAKSETSIFDTVQSAADKYGLYLGVTAHKFNDQGMRGADTISYELDDAGFDQSVVYVPTGGGGLASAICRGFKTRNSKNRVVVAQPAGCSPIASYLQGDINQPAITNCDTKISGLQLPSPPDGGLAADYIRKSDGWGTTALDDETFASQHLLSRMEGIFVEPASAISLAAVINDRKNGRLKPSDTVVLILTATGIKDLNSVEEIVTPPNQIDANDLPKAINSWTLDL
ncbi:MAG: pyridoxal-phosphate dependent enzyme [Kordiimonadaceae bacterium]|jgi:threonine synthase|nr:pyridoxal-phosphate dependent enzyme [Kordiimonadaceae bacterium]MBT6328931.1 pyridoxal-phosphate dependent enzyme [Kordiimonadaceae bacterium]MBT7583229.1 pyridoxal-phosphate dependent enzyme [Kordiimonadaceae bacterium]